MFEHYLLFAYGSLLNPNSAARAIGRNISLTEYTLTEVVGYRRLWNCGEEVFSDSLQRTVTAVFLNLAPHAGFCVSGANLRVTKSELERLALREKNYYTHVLGIDAESGLKHVTFLARAEAIVTPESPDTWLPSAYIDLVADGCQCFGREFSMKFTQTTDCVEFPLLSGAYRFTDPQQDALV
ncbi:MAG: hypothetical protein QG616_2170 [Pseudomonadota bacterium]|nr:hypothetical protein [Pseudomonadota bacterium]MDQ5947407.1 hypothetical protein [Pseudomonadota bacterium]